MTTSRHASLLWKQSSKAGGWFAALFSSDMCRYIQSKPEFNRRPTFLSSENCITKRCRTPWQNVGSFTIISSRLKPNGLLINCWVKYTKSCAWSILRVIFKEYHYLKSLFWGPHPVWSMIRSTVAIILILNEISPTHNFTFLILWFVQ